jgi:hypothetical protein
MSLSPVPASGTTRVGNPKYDVSADGARFLMITRTDTVDTAATPSQIHVVLNWTQELSERAPIN